jgi:hypothetical protein
MRQKSPHVDVLRAATTWLQAASAGAFAPASQSSNGLDHPQKIFDLTEALIGAATRTTTSQRCLAAISPPARCNVK